jgi:Rrf2 family protein
MGLPATEEFRMMTITKKADYAIRSVLYLTRSRNQSAAVDEIASSMKIPKPFLAKIFQALVRAGIASSTRGVNGGFSLSTPPEQLSIWDVIVAIDGPPDLNSCAVDARVCELSETCVVHPVWLELGQLVREQLKKETFRKLAGKG